MKTSKVKFFIVNVQGNSQKLNKKHFIAGVCQRMQRY